MRYAVSLCKYRSANLCMNVILQTRVCFGMVCDVAALKSPMHHLLSR